MVISDSARTYIAGHGGAAYVRAAQRNCCGGALVILDVTTTAPPDLDAFAPHHAGNVDVYYSGHPRGVPAQLVVELRGRLRPHLAAYKDGCAFGT